MATSLMQVSTKYSKCYPQHPSVHVFYVVRHVHTTHTMKLGPMKLGPIKKIF